MAKRAITDQAKELKAQTILDQAADMFLLLDYDKIKMSEIAKELDVSNGILFYYFKTKEALFFSLLCREYEKRLLCLTGMARDAEIRCFDDFSALVMNELTELIDHNPLYIRLEAMRTAILERNVDAELMLSKKIHLYTLMMQMVAAICQTGAVTKEEVMDVLQAEASIITGCKLSATLPLEVVEIVERNGLNEFIRDFKKDVRDTMRYYLDGYHLRKRQASYELRPLS